MSTYYEKQSENIKSRRNMNKSVSNTRSKVSIGKTTYAIEGGLADEYEGTSRMYKTAYKQSQEDMDREMRNAQIEKNMRARVAHMYDPSKSPEPGKSDGEEEHKG